jgi:hypothetical protein
MRISAVFGAAPDPGWRRVGRSVRGLFLVRCRAGLGQEIHAGVGAQPLSLPDASMPWPVIPAVPGEAAGDRAESFFRGHGTGESI